MADGKSEVRDIAAARREAAAAELAQGGGVLDATGASKRLSSFFENVESGAASPDGALEDDILEAFALLAAAAPPVYQRMRAKAKALKVPVVALEKALQGAAGAAGLAPAAAQQMMILAAFDEAGPELFIDAESGMPSVELDFAGTREAVHLASSRFEDILGRLLADRHEDLPLSTSAIKGAVAQVRARAADAGGRPSGRRLVATADTVWIDCGRLDRKQVKISAAGWRVVDPEAVIFRSRASLSLAFEPPEGTQTDLPDPGFVESQLGKLVHADTPRLRLLVVAIAYFLRGLGPFPLLVIGGPPGAAKSSTLSAIRALVDPSRLERDTVPKNDGDWAVRAVNGYMISVDNISKIDRHVSDILCSLSTGGAFSTRQLYTTTELAIIAVQRPVMITSIADIVEFPDLLDRAIFIELDALPDSERVRDRVMIDRRREIPQKLLPHIFSLLSAIMEHVEGGGLTGEAPPSARMIDFFHFAAAAEAVMEWPQGSVFATYDESRKIATLTVAEDNPILNALKRWFLTPVNGALQPDFSGTATALCMAISNHFEDGEDVKLTPRAVGRTLKENRLVLRSLGIAVEMGRTAAARCIEIKRLTVESGHA